MTGVAQPSRASTRTARVLAALPPSLRGAALMPAAALLVHQLRYELAFGSDAPRALAMQGHAYLTSSMPWIVLLTTLALGAALGSLARRWAGGGGASAAPRRLAGLHVWLLVAGALFGVYAGQELLEGWLAAGHPFGLAGVLGAGGWLALPLALAVGGALTLVLRAHAAASTVLAERRPLRVRLSAAAEALLGAVRIAPALIGSAPLARRAAGRAPPRAVAAATQA